MGDLWVIQIHLFTDSVVQKQDQLYTNNTQQILKEHTFSNKILYQR